MTHRTIYCKLHKVYISEMVCWIKYYRGKLEFNSDVHDHNTRHKTDLHPLTCRTNLTKKQRFKYGYNTIQQIARTAKETGN